MLQTTVLYYYPHSYPPPPTHTKFFFLFLSNLILGQPATAAWLPTNNPYIRFHGNADFSEMLWPTYGWYAINQSTHKQVDD